MTSIKFKPINGKITTNGEVSGSNHDSGNQENQLTNASNQDTLEYLPKVPADVAANTQSAPSTATAGASLISSSAVAAAFNGLTPEKMALMAKLMPTSQIDDDSKKIIEEKFIETLTSPNLIIQMRDASMDLKSSHKVLEKVLLILKEGKASIPANWLNETFGWDKLDTIGRQLYKSILIETLRFGAPLSRFYFAPKDMKDDLDVVIAGIKSYPRLLTESFSLGSTRRSNSTIHDNHELVKFAKSLKENNFNHDEIDVALAAAGYKPNSN